MFVGRKNELNQISNYIINNDGKILLVYGRKGIGKTSLLKEALKERRHAYFTAYETTGSQELSILAREVNIESVSSVEELLANILKAASGREYTVVIDNYPAFVKADSSFSDALYKAFKEDFALNGIRLILISDSYLAAEKMVFGKKALWTNDISLSMELKPLDFYEAEAFYPNSENSEKAFFYGLSGGIPAVLNQLSTDSKNSIENLFFTENQNRYLPEDNIKEELREMSNYNRVLTALSNDYTRVNELSRATERAKDIVVPYMNTLMDLSVVTKECPVTEKTNRKKTRYSIVNSYDYFWYRYIVSNMNLYLTSKYDEILKIIEKDKSNFLKRVYTDIVKTAIKKNKCPGLSFSTEDIGNWWENDDEKKTTEGFDLVAIGESDEKKAFVYGRIYCNDKPLDMRELKSLIELTRKVNEKGVIYYLAFSSNGFLETARTAAAAIKNILLVSLEDIV